MSRKENQWLCQWRWQENTDISGLVKKTDYNAKITEREGKMPKITGLATIATLTAVENKIPNISGLVKETDYDAKV